MNMTNGNAELQMERAMRRVAAGATICTVLIALSTLSGCSRDNESTAPVGQPLPLLAAKPAATPARSPAAIPQSTLVKAVSADKSAAAVDLHFELPAKPAVGVPFMVELVLTPRLAAENLDIEIAGMDGLTLQGQNRFQFGNVHAGQPYRAKVAMQSTVAGMYYVSVVARATSQATTEARTFAVPVVIGPVAPLAQKPAPQRDSRGQAVERMEAKEPNT